MVGKDRRKVGKKLSSKALGEGGPLEVKWHSAGTGGQTSAKPEIKTKEVTRDLRPTR